MSKNRSRFMVCGAALNVWQPTGPAREMKIVDGSPKARSNGVMIRTLRFTSLCLLSTSMLLFAGCGGDDGDGDDEAAGTDTDDTTGTDTEAGTETDDDVGTTTTTEEDTSETVDEAETSLDTTEETTAEETTAEETTETTAETTADETTETTEGGECPADPGDDECTACLKENCCSELNECFADEDCACVTLCLQGGGDPLSCSMECEVNGLPPELQQLGGCTQAQCGQQCGL